jgi:signal transduction histidine kinase
MTEALRIIRENLDKLKRDIINFLDIEKLSQGRVFYNHNQIINLSEMIEQKAKLFREIASRKKITMSIAVSPRLYIKADPSAIDRIVNNLLDNAIKFTAEYGTIETYLKKKQRCAFYCQRYGNGDSKRPSRFYIRTF